MAADPGFDDERQAIEKRLGDNWATTPIKYENAPFKETQSPYVAVFVRRGEGLQASLGTVPLRRWPGLIIVQIFVKAQTGTQTALAYANTIGAIFERQEFSAGASGLIRCRVASATIVGERHGWFQVNVTVPYHRDKAY